MPAQKLLCRNPISSRQNRARSVVTATCMSASEHREIITIPGNPTNQKNNSVGPSVRPQNETRAEGVAMLFHRCRARESTRETLVKGSDFKA
jgi:hypothetical protein